MLSTVRATWGYGEYGWPYSFAPKGSMGGKAARIPMPGRI